MKQRSFDFIVSLIAIVALSPLFAIIALAIKIDSKGPVFFRQKRMGRNLKPFNILKFRTMSDRLNNRVPDITIAGDSRITKVGRVLRKYKIDELPQFINILRGEMSFVGSRPEIPKYVYSFKKDYKFLLKWRPGMTDPASLVYRNEESVLARSANWEKHYMEHILPHKIRLSVHYLENRRFFSDLKIIFITILGRDLPKNFLPPF